MERDTRRGERGREMIKGSWRERYRRREREISTVYRKREREMLVR